MRYGSAIGAGFGLLFVLANPQIHCPDPSICTTSPDKMSRGEELAGGVVGGGLLGLAVGGIYGVTRKSERWIRRPLGTTAVGASLVTRGTGIGVRLRF